MTFSTNPYNIQIVFFIVSIFMVTFHFRSSIANLTRIWLNYISSRYVLLEIRISTIFMSLFNVSNFVSNSIFFYVGFLFKPFKLQERLSLSKAFICSPLYLCKYTSTLFAVGTIKSFFSYFVTGIEHV